VVIAISPNYTGYSTLVTVGRHRAFLLICQSSQRFRSVHRVRFRITFNHSCLRPARRGFPLFSKVCESGVTSVDATVPNVYETRDSWRGPNYGIAPFLALEGFEPSTLTPAQGPVGNYLSTVTRASVSWIEAWPYHRRTCSGPKRTCSQDYGQLRLPIPSHRGLVIPPTFN